jgi:hypothetical protein
MGYNTLSRDADMAPKTTTTQVRASFDELAAAVSCLEELTPKLEERLRMVIRSEPDGPEKPAVETGYSTPLATEHKGLADRLQRVHKTLNRLYSLLEV